jgi:hypothetical protein
LKDEIQYLIDREFKAPNNFQKRQKQFRKFDEEQSSFITYRIPDSEKNKLPDLPVDHLVPTGGVSTKKKTICVPTNQNDTHANNKNSVFLTQLPGNPEGTTISNSNNNLNSLASPRKTERKTTVMKPSPPGYDNNRRRSALPNYADVHVNLVGGSMISDSKFTYDYSNQLETIIRKNEEVSRKIAFRIPLVLTMFFCFLSIREIKWKK